MAKAIPAIYENGVLRPLAPVHLSESQTVWLQVLPEQTMTGLQHELGPLYESGLLTSPTPSDAEPISDADLAAMVESIHVTGQPLSETIIEDRGEW
ncbi:MAG: antitoxin family protein [Cyanomargarita calcarea GSE-NOS-MK-12-04C]|jgi:predicted DNA-binding antitoxin AbrB/MazE fold protein|uniref:Antitoxin family protein n=1 Tax=Cyanomargarita calcarea GSE-NOS-MK-12-04C TaxID=2839659 RepID=A0A951USS5_9CYAN|nr:antitoxin family protein [Cyanomargarita calcarea GSE-NOS-MK-12-04C]